MSGEEKGFTSRWSKRKSAARQEDGAVIDDDVANSLAAEEQLDSLENDASPDELLTEADFEDVDFEALDKSSDYTRFIKANVPASIQQKALRKLWDSDSVFEVLDGMNDYDEDFTGNGLAGKAFKTAYKVGRGFLTDDDEKPTEKTADTEVEDSTESVEQQEALQVETGDNTAEVSSEVSTRDSTEKPDLV